MLFLIVCCFYFFNYIFIYLMGDVHKNEEGHDNLWESVLSFCLMNPGDQSQAAGLAVSIKHLSPLSHLTNPF